MVQLTEEKEVNFFKKIRIKNKETKKLLHEVKLEKVVVLKSLGIAFLISLFFVIPFVFLIINLAMFGTITVLILLYLAFITFFTTFLFVYYDVAKFFDERYKEHNFKPYILTQVTIFTVVSILFYIIKEAIF